MSERLFGQRVPETAYERGYVDGEQFALEGVIQLLEDLKPSCFCDDCEEYSTRSMEYLGAIQDLIKGENK